MSKNNEKKAALENFKMQAANEVGVNLKQGYNGDLTSKQAGSIGGQMVNIKLPIRTVKYDRISRISDGHLLGVEYTYSLIP